MKIAVTGGSGFIGSAVIKYAKSLGHQVWSFDKADGDNILGDLNNLSGADVVVHLAGILGVSELFDKAEEAIDTNIRGTLRVLRVCQRDNIGYVGITMPPVFPSVYTATKLCAFNLAEAWRKAYDLRVSHVVAYNTYGIGQKHGPTHPQKIIPTFASKAWKKEPIPIWGDGSQTVDLIHVDDVARILVEACKFGDGEVFDAGCGIKWSVLEIAEDIATYCNSPTPHEFLPMRKGEIPCDIVAKGQGWDKLCWKPTWAAKAFYETIESYKPK